MISAEVMRALTVAGHPVAEPCERCGRRPEPTLDTMIQWLVQRRQTEFSLAIGPDGRWRAIGRWPGPDRQLEAEGQSPADALAKIVLDVIAREGSAQSSSR